MSSNKTTTCTIYGASDDLIEIDGAIREEFNPPLDGDDESASYLAFSNGVVLRVKYDSDGIWRIFKKRGDESLVSIKQCEGDGDGDDYSDIATVEGVDWVVFGDRFEVAR